MAATTSLTELRKMPLSDLLKEIRSQQATVAKLHLNVQLGKEKDHAKYRREKRQLARMLTVQSQTEAAAADTAADGSASSSAQS